MSRLLDSTTTVSSETESEEVAHSGLVRIFNIISRLGGLYALLVVLISLLLVPIYKALAIHNTVNGILEVEGKAKLEKTEQHFPKNENNQLKEHKTKSVMYRQHSQMVKISNVGKWRRSEDAGRLQYDRYWSNNLKEIVHGNSNHRASVHNSILDKEPTCSTQVKFTLTDLVSQIFCCFKVQFHSFLCQVAMLVLTWV